jgi:hypothetical protein
MNEVRFKYLAVGAVCAAFACVSGESIAQLSGGGGSGEEFAPCDVAVAPLSQAVLDQLSAAGALACAMAGPTGDGPISECCPWAIASVAAPVPLGPVTITAGPTVTGPRAIRQRVWQVPPPPTPLPCTAEPIPPIPVVIDETETTRWNREVCWGGTVSGGLPTITAGIAVQLKAAVEAEIRLGTAPITMTANGNGCVTWTSETIVRLQHGTPQHPIMIACGRRLAIRRRSP